MNIIKENLDFLIYDAIRTKEFRQNMKQGKLSIAEIMKEIDDDHIEIKEDKCPVKKPRIGKDYQAYIPELETLDFKR